jgi:hypothetical protein
LIMPTGLVAEFARIPSTRGDRNSGEFLTFRTSVTSVDGGKQEKVHNPWQCNGDAAKEG